MMDLLRLRPERVNHVWSYDFVSSRTQDGRTIRMLTLHTLDQTVLCDFITDGHLGRRL
jgi:hypothetical protein